MCAYVCKVAMGFGLFFVYIILHTKQGWSHRQLLSLHCTLAYKKRLLIVRFMDAMATSNAVKELNRFLVISD